MIWPADIPNFNVAERSRRALFVTYGAGHVAKVAPVLRELERSNVECLLVALTIGYKKATQLGLKPLGYRDFLPLWGDRVPEIIERGRSLFEGNTHPDVDAFETCCYMGTNYQEWVDCMGEAAARELYNQKGRQAFFPVGFMGRLLDALQPGIVIATSTPRSEEACIAAAVQRDIPTLTMVDLFAPPSDPFLRRRFQADRITVVSEEVRTRFIEHGLAAEQVVVTGSPDFDELFEAQVVAAGEAFRAARGWHTHTVVMWAGILEPDDAEVPGVTMPLEVENRLRAWVAATPGTALVVRYHPGHYHRFPTQPAQANVHVSVPGVEPIAPLLRAADVVIHQVSTVGLQAALLGKRVLSLDFSAWVPRAEFDLSSLGPCEAIASIEDVVPVLTGAPRLDGGPTMAVPRGPAAPRVTAVALELLNRLKLS